MKTCPLCMFDELEDRKPYENHVIDLGKMALWHHEWRHNPLMGTQTEIVFPHIDVIHIVSEHLIGPLEESKVWSFLWKTAMFNY